MTVVNRSRGPKPHWYADFTIRGTRHRDSIPEARTKADAVEAENALRRQVFEGTYGIPKLGAQLFTEFVDKTYLPWAKTNKRSWRDDVWVTDVLKETFRGKKLCEVSPLMIEKLKRDLKEAKTVRGTPRAAASVNSMLSIGSRIFTLAVDMEAAARNPFRKVNLLPVDNQQHRYLTWEEETRLMEMLINPPVRVRSPRGSKGTIRRELCSPSQQSPPMMRGSTEETTLVSPNATKLSLPIMPSSNMKGVKKSGSSNWRQQSSSSSASGGVRLNHRLKSVPPEAAAAGVQFVPDSESKGPSASPAVANPSYESSLRASVSRGNPAPINERQINGNSTHNSNGAGNISYLSPSSQASDAQERSTLQLKSASPLPTAISVLAKRGSRRGSRRGSKRSDNPRRSRNAKSSRTSIELKAAQRAHLLAAIPIALGTGLRREEQTRLRAKHCDFARNVIVVESTTNNPNKTNRLREVPMNDDVRAVLRRLCHGKRPDEYLMLNPNTKRPYRDFKKGFGAACAEAGITNFTWKALRHTFATRLGEAGYTAGVIADLLGHGDVRTTMRYTHSTDRRKHEAVQATMMSRRAG